MPTAEEKARGAGNGNGRSKKVAEGKAGRLASAFGAGLPEASMAWDEVDPRHIAWLVSVVTRKGGAVMFGASRDGGALMVTMLLDGEKMQKWISPRDVPEDVITFICETFDTL
jgi:hypothetical protein